MRDPERHGPAVDTAKVRGKRFRGYVARLLADMAGRLESSYADLKKTVEEALEHQAATSEVLRVISSSPAELEPVFQAMLANATRLCEASFGIMFRYETEVFHTVALLGVPSAYAEDLHRGPRVPGPNSAL